MAKQTAAAVVHGPERITQREALESGVRTADEMPDFTKAVKLKYWALPVGEFFGNRTNRLITAPGDYADGEISGRCDDISLFPGGVVVLTINQGWQPGKPEHEQVMRKRYVVCIGSCHGVTP